MKQLLKFMLALCMAATMAFTMLPAASAQETTDDPATTSVTYENGEKAYDLVWKFKSDGGHLWKRRWNKTLNCWYDPAWILVQ